MKARVRVGVAFVAGAVVALVVVGLWTYAVVGLGEPQAGRELVHSGVQSVTVCDKHHGNSFNLMPISGGDVGTWGPEKKGDCVVWYHYLEAEE